MSLRKRLDEISEPAELFPDLTNAEKETNRLLVEIAQQIQSRRKELNRTQKQLAEMLSVSQPMVCQWESGDYNFSIDSLVQVLDSLNLRIEVTFSSVEKDLTIPALKTGYKVAEGTHNESVPNMIFEAA